MRTYLKDTIKPLIPETVRNAIVPVTKVQSTITNGTKVKDGQTTTDDVWIPSIHEVASPNTTYESTGATYTKFSTPTSRIKKRKGSASKWWTRSAYAAAKWNCYDATGTYASIDAYNSNGVALGFCT